MELGLQIPGDLGQGQAGALGWAWELCDRGHSSGAAVRPQQQLQSLHLVGWPHPRDLLMGWWLPALGACLAITLVPLQ